MLSMVFQLLMCAVVVFGIVLCVSIIVAGVPDKKNDQGTKNNFDQSKG